MGGALTTVVKEAEPDHSACLAQSGRLHCLLESECALANNAPALA